MDTAELIWTDAKPPPMKDAPDFSDTTKVLDELRQLENSIRKNVMRSGGLLSEMWHGKWFVSAEYPNRTLTNMSCWLLQDHSIDLATQDLRDRIGPFDTFAKFGDVVMDWIEPFAPSTAYQLARAARLMLPMDPLLMSDDEIVDARQFFIEPLMAACPYGTASRDVFPKLHAAGLLTDFGGGGRGFRKKPSELSLLEIIKLSDDGMIEGMYIPRRHKRRDIKVEQRWSKWVNEYCEANDIERDEAFRRIMEIAMKQLSIKKSDAA